MQPTACFSLPEGAHTVGHRHPIPAAKRRQNAAHGASRGSIAGGSQSPEGAKETDAMTPLRPRPSNCAKGAIRGPRTPNPSREAAPECSPRRKPWVNYGNFAKPRRGERKAIAW